MDLGNVDTKEAFVLIWLAMKYFIKSTDFLPILRKAYCEIDIALWSQHITQWHLNFIGTIWNSNCQRHTTEQQNWIHGLSAYLKGWDADLRCRVRLKIEHDANTTEDFWKIVKEILDDNRPGTRSVKETMPLGQGQRTNKR